MTTNLNPNARPFYPNNVTGPDVNFADQYPEQDDFNAANPNNPINPNMKSILDVLKNILQQTTNSNDFALPGISSKNTNFLKTVQNELVAILDKIKLVSTTIKEIKNINTNVTKQLNDSKDNGLTNAEIVKLVNKLKLAMDKQSGLIQTVSDTSGQIQTTFNDNIKPINQALNDLSSGQSGGKVKRKSRKNKRGGWTIASASASASASRSNRSRRRKRRQYSDISA